MTKLHDVAAALSRHRGRGNGITARQLACELGITDRQLRHFISDLREDGIAIGGHPRTGYFIINDAMELESTCAFLRARALHSLMLESRLRKIALPDLLHQLRLPT